MKVQDTGFEFVHILTTQSDCVFCAARANVVGARSRSLRSLASLRVTGNGHRRRRDVSFAASRGHGLARAQCIRIPSHIRYAFNSPMPNAGHKRRTCLRRHCSSIIERSAGSVFAQILERFVEAYRHLAEGVSRSQPVVAGHTSMEIDLWYVHEDTRGELVIDRRSRQGSVLSPARGASQDGTFRVREPGSVRVASACLSDS
ncbi:hypothetical protein OH76DRAFT_256743 [Lentinus brumalis]|uniref:Uncharacterized protein n=1 Tax=Lentinus brumalis TaxID=2498619 RepID=A0A371CL84_9APHY|nr:hypothetical protein OH76DRAFT_256743 [Polyporus brumalis]